MTVFQTFNFEMLTNLVQELKTGILIDDTSDAVTINNIISWSLLADTQMLRTKYVQLVKLTLKTKS